ncbi:coenzyme A transporter [Saccharomycopsis crataegensis]|uniref:Coenzyme A transporter n=1 Tax=Saccharomycopsis crataegensis TaxID=43959 RepID=A0AAV5QPX1_9ASCO|nr:coenzyme A transporter [Saccharomycopsis crataegensis]
MSPSISTDLNDDASLPSSSPQQSPKLTSYNIEHPAVTATKPTIIAASTKNSTAIRHNVDKTSLHYVTLTALAGGIAGCSAKSLIAPLDRIKILFQTSNPEFKEFSSSYFGLSKAAKKIFHNDGFVGFFQGHSVTLIRIFPYAAIKFVAYEQIRNLLIPSDVYETNGRRLLAGSISGIISVFCTYPLDLLRVRMAFDTKYRDQHPQKRIMNGRLLNTFASIINEPTKYQSSKIATISSSKLYHKLLGTTNFYRGFSPTIIGMIPYAGVSFWTHDFVHDIFRSKILSKFTVDYSNCSTNNTMQKESHDHRPPLKAWAQLIAGGVAGLVSQTASYPFEVIRRRLQVGAVTNDGKYYSMVQMAKIIHGERGLKGFYVGLSIGYIKVIPMVACSFFVYERMKYFLGI